MDFPGGLKSYLETQFSNCAAPNIEFKNNPELLYYTSEDKKTECKLQDWLQTLTEDTFVTTFTAYVKTIVGDNAILDQKLELTKKNLNEIAIHSPLELEKLLLSATGLAFHRFIINALASNQNYKLDEKAINIVEDKLELCKDNALKSAATILINHITHHDGGSKHAEFLAKFIIKPDCSESVRETVLTKFINEAKGIKDGQVFTSFEKALPYDKADNKLVLALAHAAKNSCYTPSLESLVHFEKLLDSIEEIEQALGLAAISKSLQSILKHPNEIQHFGIVEQKINLLFSKVGKLPTGLVNAVFDVYHHNQNHLANIVIDIVATHNGLSKESLNKLVEPLMQVKDLKASLFIGLRLVQNHVALPKDVLVYFKGLSGHIDASIKLMAAKLFDQLDHGTPKANARFGLSLEKLGWSSDILSSLSKNVGENDSPILASTLEKIYDYKVTTEDFDRNGQTALAILKNKKPEEWRAAINRLINDNHFFIAKELEQLLSEITELNLNTPMILKLVENGWFVDQLDKIAKFQSGIGEWQKDDFIKWRHGIQKVNDKNIAEVLAVLSQAIHNTVLENKHYPRQIQIISVLALYKSANGGVIQVGTGEGKSVIIGMLAAIKVISGQTVDIVTSSPDLAIRDWKELKDFYHLLGITVDHNIVGGTGSKTCYLAHVVYGTLLYFIGDTLRDITENTKFGRGFEVVMVDEFDDPVIDQNSMKVQLASTIPGFEVLKELLTYMWGESISLANLLETRDDGNCYMVNPTLNQTLAEELGIANVTNSTNADTSSLWVAANCLDYTKEYIGNYTKNILLAPEKDRTSKTVVLPKHLVNFTSDHLPAWLDSLTLSYDHFNNFNYLVGIPPVEIMNTSNTNTVAPIDYEHMGVIQYGLMWANGLHQFLELRHALTLHPENLISTFMSYSGYLSKYIGSVFGFTGSLGGSEDHNYMKQSYGVEAIVMPTFIHKDVTRFDSLVLEDSEEWQDKLVAIIKSKVGSDRAGLVVVSTIAEVHAMAKLFTDSGINASKLFKYGVGGKDEASIIKRGLKSGELLVATSAAGRGMHLKLSKEVLASGGLHVMLTYLPASIRGQEQVEGRGARKGEPGSTQLVVHMEQFPNSDCPADISCLLTERDAEETIRLVEDRLCKSPVIKLGDELFKKYIELIREINPPTGYRLSLNKPELKTVTPKTLYLYQENGAIYLQVVKPDFTSFTQDITKQLIATELKVSKHISSILQRNDSSVSSLNQPDFEMLQFLLAKQPGLSVNPIIYERAQQNFSEAIAHGVPAEWREKEPTRYGSNAERNYLTGLLFENNDYADLKAAMIANDSAIDDDILAKVKDRRHFHGWLAVRALYSDEYENRQITENWAKWFKNQSHSFRQFDNCAIATEQEQSDTLEIQKAIKDRLIEEFRLFRLGIIAQAKNLELMQNPTYLVQKAWRYTKIYSEQQKPTPSYYETSSSISSSWSYFTNTFNYAYTTLKDMASASINYLASFGGFGNYQVDNPLNDAVKFLDAAIKLDETYAWTAPNAASYIRLLDDGRYINDYKEDKVKARNAKMQFGYDASEAIKRIQQWTIHPIEIQLGYLMSKGLVDYSDELFVQLVGTIKVYEKIIEAIYNNIRTVEKATDKQMVYVRNHITLEQLTDGINITQTIVDFVNRSGTIDQITLQSIRNTTSELSFASLQMITNAIAADGGAVLDLGYRDLYEEKDWTGTVFSALLGVGQIFAGIAIMSVGGVFATSFGFSLISQGIGDIISAGMSVAKGMPLDFGNYLNSKGMSMGIALATAGTLHFLSSVPALQNTPLVGKLIGGIKPGADETARIFTTNPHLFVGKIIGTNVLGTLMGSVLYNGAKPLVDREDIAGKAAREAEMLAHEYEAALNKVMAADALNGNTKLMQSLKDKISAAAHRYLGFLNEKATKVATGYTTSVVGSMMGGVGSVMGFGIGSMLQAGTTVALGTIKNMKAMDSIVHKTRQLIVEISNAAGDVPASALAKKYELNGFKAHVISELTGSVVHIQKHEFVEPLANNIGSYVASQAAEYIEKKWKESQTQEQTKEHNRQKVDPEKASEKMHKAKHYDAELEKVLEGIINEENKFNREQTKAENEAKVAGYVEILNKPGLSKSGKQKVLEFIKQVEQPIESSPPSPTDTSLSQEMTKTKWTAQKLVAAKEAYDEFAAKYPNLAKYGLSAANIAVQTLLGGMVGFFNSVRSEGIGLTVGEVAGEYIAGGVEALIDKGSQKLKVSHPELSEREARALVGASLLGTAAIADGSAGIKQVLHHIDKPHTKVGSTDSTTPLKNNDKADKINDIDDHDKTAYELRNTPGKATGGDNLPIIEDNWFKGTHNNVGKLPKQIADKMQGMDFRNFDHFRETVWKLVANDPKLSLNFEPEILNGMKKGIAPLAPLEQWNGKIDSYQLHHIKPIHDKGGVYDLNNIVIVTPRYHKEILNPSYHRGKTK
jgi:hypothetical protein